MKTYNSIHRLNTLKNRLDQIELAGLATLISMTNTLNLNVTFKEIKFKMASRSHMIACDDISCGRIQSNQI